jgi:Spy/CpxP family protein refolding chaperone
MRRTTHRFLIVSGLMLAALAMAPARRAAAQAEGGAPAARPVAGTSVAQFLAEHPQALRLTAKQVDRIRKVATRLDSANAPLRSQLKELTGGRALRDMDPVERRRLVPQVQPIMQQLRVNNEGSLDSVDAILTPDQQNALQALMEEYQRRMQARRARAGRQQP